MKSIYLTSKVAPLSPESIRKKIAELAPKHVRINLAALAREIGISTQLCRYHWYRYCSDRVLDSLSLEALRNTGFSSSSSEKYKATKRQKRTGTSTADADSENDS